MPVAIKPKRSSTPSATPTGLADGELAINIPDKKIYIGNSSGVGVLLVDGNGGSGSGNSNFRTTSQTIGTSQVTLDTTTISSGVRGVEYTLAAKDNTNSRYKISKITVVTDGTTSDFNEYSVLKSNNSFEVCTIDSDVSGGNLRLLGTGDSSNVSIQLLKVVFDSSIANNSIGSFFASQPVKVSTTEIDFGTPAVNSKKFTITDSAINSNSIISVVQSGSAATGRLEDENELTALTFAAKPNSGNFTLYAHCVNGLVSGKHKINYIVG